MFWCPASCERPSLWRWDRQLSILAETTFDESRVNLEFFQAPGSAELGVQRACCPARFTPSLSLKAAVQPKGGIPLGPWPRSVWGLGVERQKILCLNVRLGGLLRRAVHRGG